MKDYFYDVIDKLNKKKYEITYMNRQTVSDFKLDDLLGYYISEEVKYIYSKYKVFELNWISDNNKGFVKFIPYDVLEKKHRNIIEIMQECYDINEDSYDIKRDIENWYPIFEFPNGDSFCLDIRNGKVVFYDHEVYDLGVNLHGLVIALSINDLFEKWSKCLFVDIYDWSEGVDENGIDLNKSIFAQCIFDDYNNI